MILLKIELIEFERKGLIKIKYQKWLLYTNGPIVWIDFSIKVPEIRTFWVCLDLSKIKFRQSDL